MKEKLVSVIIANWNGGEVFKSCLESLAKIKYPRWELIVVDNGSIDGSERLPQSLELPVANLQLIQNKTNIGFAKANNQGYKKTKGEYVLLLNNDTQVTPFFLNILVAKMEKQRDLGVVQPKILLMDRPGYLDNAGSFMTRIGFLQHWGFLQKDGAEFQNEREIFSAKGACLLIRRSAIERVGLFDNEFVSYFEESDFCWRVWLAGFKVLYYPKAEIYHKLGFTIRRQNVLQINYHYYKNRIASLLKNLSPGNLLWILPLHIFISLGIFVLFLSRMQVRNSLMILKAFLWNLINLPQILKKRAMVQHMRIVKDSVLFKDLMHPIPWKKFASDFKRVEGDLKNTNEEVL